MVIITALKNAGNEFLTKFKAQIKEQEKLKRQYSEAQYRALRSQVNQPKQHSIKV